MIPALQVRVRRKSYPTFLLESRGSASDRGEVIHALSDEASWNGSSVTVDCGALC
jgi:hypothetical protein